MIHKTALLIFMLTCFLLPAKLYKSEKFYYSVNFPEKWVLVKKRSDGIFFRNNQKNAFIEVIVYNSDDVETIEEAFNTFATRFKMKGKPGRTTFCTYPALRGTLSFSFQGSSYIMDLVAFKDSYYCYLVMGYASRDAFESKQIELAKIVNSCKLYYDNNVVYSNDSSTTTTNDNSNKKGSDDFSNEDTRKKDTKTTEVEKSDGEYSFPISIDNVRRKTFILSKNDLNNSIRELNRMMEPDFYSYFNIDYKNDPDHQFTFWKRFYREVYNKNYNRVTPMVNYFKEEARKNKWSSYQLAENVIKAVQEIPYERPYKIVKKETTAKILDFFTPHQTGWYKKGDCDTKSMLIVLILGRLGYEAIMYYSAHYKHAMAGININANGTYMKLGNKKFYFIESTYPGWKIGDLPPDMKNTSKWRAVAVQ